MWNGTRRMADAIAKGIHKKDSGVNIKVHNAAKTDKNDIITDIFKSRAVLIGSPTINRGILTSIAGLIEEIKGLDFKGKKAAAFGCYGWSGESVKILTDLLKQSGFEIINEGIKALWNPDEDSLQSAFKFGQDLAIEIEKIV
jgi:flavorubredoxin